jgi:excisionase family DNA binding protein
MNDYLTVEEFAARYRLSESAVYRALREGRLAGIQVLRRWRIPLSACPEPASADQRTDPMPRPARPRSSGRLRSKVVELDGRRGR